MNPFYITGIIPSEYFCDRKKETVRLKKHILSGANVLLTSQRRMGKTQLVRHVFEEPEIRDSRYTFYVDIFPTTSLSEFVFYLSREVYSVLVPKGRKALDVFVSAVRSISATFGYNPATGCPEFGLKLGDILSPELTLSEIFGYLENADKKCVFAIDEFQQIASYPEKNTEAILRAHIQSMNNCCFIFSGSDRHILENMFNSYAKPFYNSAEMCFLGRIDRDVYVDFIVRNFEKEGKKIEREAAEYIYDMFEGHTYFVHNVMHHTFDFVGTDEIVTRESMDTIVRDIVDEKSHSFGETMSLMNFQQKETIVAIAKDGVAEEITSVAFVRKHSLQSPSSVQNAVRHLLARQMITYEIQGKKKRYRISDRFFEKWIVENY